MVIPSLFTEVIYRNYGLRCEPVYLMITKLCCTFFRLRPFNVSSFLFLHLTQEEIIQLLPTEEKQCVEKHLLRPEELIKLCLKCQDAKLSLCAFDVFAWTSSSFRKTHRNLLEECWKNAADQDDWSELYQASTAQGWSDEETLQNLRETVLFLASNRCYGPNAETFGEGFDEVLPLRLENADPPVLRDSSSVESILMQHNDFPEAGKLMLTSIMLGSVQDDTRLEEGPSPME